MDRAGFGLFSTYLVFLVLLSVLSRHVNVRSHIVQGLVPVFFVWVLVVLCTVRVCRFKMDRGLKLVFAEGHPCTLLLRRRLCFRFARLLGCS